MQVGECASSLDLAITGGLQQRSIGLDEIGRDLLYLARCQRSHHAAVWADACRRAEYPIAPLAHPHRCAVVLIACAARLGIERPLALVIRQAVPHEVAGMVEDNRWLGFRPQGASDLLEVEGE